MLCFLCNHDALCKSKTLRGTDLLAMAAPPPPAAQVSAKSVSIPLMPSAWQVQTIGFLSHLHKEISKAGRKPFLVLGPLSTLPNWMSEFKRWCPTMTAVLYHGNKEKRAELRAGDLAPGASGNDTVGGKSLLRSCCLAAVLAGGFLVARRVPSRSNMTCSA